MASQFATENGHKIARLLKYYEGPPYNIPELLDTELQKVREVLDGLRTNKRIPCWCAVLPDGVMSVHEATGEHDDWCQRARALMEKLEVK